MSNDKTLVEDKVMVELTRPRTADDLLSIGGFVIAELFGPDGELKQRVAGKNLVTAVGDQMYAARGSGVGTPPNAPTGMKLGTGSTAAAKTGAGAALVAFFSASQKAFDGSFPTAAAGVATYKTTWNAGEATTSGTPLAEVVIVNETLANSTSTAANTVSRFVFAAAITKGASDTLAVTWTHTLLGA